MGAGKTTLGERVARRLGRRFVDLDRDLERRTAKRVPQLFGAHGEGVFRVLEAGTTVQALRDPEPAVLALGGGAITSDAIRAALRERAVTVLVEVDADEAWRRVGGSDRPLARDERRFRELFEERRPLYLASADVTARNRAATSALAGSAFRAARTWRRAPPAEPRRRYSRRGQ